MPKALSLSPVIPGERQQGKQHPRTRIGYRLQELEDLNDRLGAENLHIDRVLCRIDAGASPWKSALDAHNLPPFSHIDSIDFAVELPYLDDRQNANRAAEAAFAAALLPTSNVYFDPLIDFDRTMDISHGLLDTLCNPRPPFHVLRCLNTILYGPDRPDAPLHPSETRAGPLKTRTLAGPDATFCLLTSEAQNDPLPANLPLLSDLPGNTPVRLYRLREGTVEASSVERIQDTIEGSGLQGPLLITTV